MLAWTRRMQPSIIWWRALRAYVRLYDEEAVPDELAQRAKRQLTRYLDMLASAMTDGSTAARLAALNAVVLDYVQSDRIF